MNLRENSFQQGEDDGHQAMVQDSAPQNSQGNASSSINPQAIVQALLLQSSILPGYEPL